MTFALDGKSLLLACPADAALKAVESFLKPLGLTLGYRPARAVRTVREALERRVGNLLAERYGEIDDLCVSLKAAANGGLVRTKNVPRAATGPDFKKLLAAHGRLIEATFRVSPAPEARAKFRARWKRGNGTGVFLRLFWASGIRPAAFRRKGGAFDIELEGFSDIVRAETAELKALVRKTKGTLHARS